MFILDIFFVECIFFSIWTLLTFLYSCTTRNIVRLKKFQFHVQFYYDF